MPSAQPAPRARLIALLALCVLGVAFFHRAVFTDKLFLARDIFRVYIPLDHYWATRVASGEFPDWYPFDGLGQPFVGMVISSAFHPSKLLYLVLPLGPAMKLNVLACYPIAFAGMLLLARRLGLGGAAALVPAITYALSGYLIGISNNVIYLMACATLPWAFWAVDRFVEEPTPAAAGLSALLLALILFSGDPQAFAVCCALVLVWMFARWRGAPVRRVALYATVVMLFTAGLAAVQLLPSLHSLSQGGMSKQSVMAAMRWSVHPLRLIEMLVGSVFVTTPNSPEGRAIALNLMGAGMDSLWVDSLHVGLPAVVFAGVALVVHRRSRTAWLMAAAATFLLLLALGRFGGLYQLVYQVVPPWRAFRTPEKLIPFFVLALALAAGFGLRATLESERVRRGVSHVFWGAAGVSLVFFGLERGARLYSRLLAALWRGEPSEVAVTTLGALFETGLLQTAAVALVLGTALRFVRRPDLLAVLVPLTCALHFFVATEPIYQLAIPEALTTPPPFAARVLGEPSGVPVRVLDASTWVAVPKIEGLDIMDSKAFVLSATMCSAIPSLHGIENANAYLPGASRRAVRLIDAALKTPRHLGGALAVRHVVEDAARERQNGVVERLPAFRLQLAEVPAVPRVYLSRPRCVATQDEALEWLRRAEPGTWSETAVECAAPVEEPSGTWEPGRVEIEEYRPELQRFRVEASQPSLLVVAEAFYSGWSATVDGSPAEILPANGALRGVVVAAGAHTVEFRYRTPGLVAGALLSLLTALACAVWAWLARSRSHPAKGEKFTTT
jgi:hypothetical protein